MVLWLQDSYLWMHTKFSFLRRMSLCPGHLLNQQSLFKSILFFTVHFQLFRCVGLFPCCRISIFNLFFNDESSNIIKLCSSFVSYISASYSSIIFIVSVSIFSPNFPDISSILWFFDWILSLTTSACLGAWSSLLLNSNIDQQIQKNLKEYLYYNEVINLTKYLATPLSLWFCKRI